MFFVKNIQTMNEIDKRQFKYDYILFPALYQFVLNDMIYVGITHIMSSTTHGKHGEVANQNKVSSISFNSKLFFKASLTLTYKVTTALNFEC